eukprot:3660177-Lingulodinium_polyedra.AAC.1
MANGSMALPGATARAAAARRRRCHSCQRRHSGHVSPTASGGHASSRGPRQTLPVASYFSIVRHLFGSGPGHG